MNEIAKIDGGVIADPLLDLIEKIATSPDTPIERMQAIMDMRERQMAKAAEQEFNVAFAAAMAEMPDVPRSGQNAHSRNRYSTLDDLIRTVRPVLARHGLSLNWLTRSEGDNRITVTAVVRHSGGHQISTEQTGDRDNAKQMNRLQGGGSTETYLKRYSGFSILGLSSGDEKDDDGVSAERSATISAEQYITLHNMLSEIGEDAEARFCRSAGISDLENLLAARFESARNAIRAKLPQGGA